MKKIKRDSPLKFAPWIDEERWAAFCSALERGATMDQLMAATGYGQRTMYRWIRALNAGAMGHPSGRSPVRMDVLVEGRKVSRWVLSA